MLLVQCSLICFLSIKFVCLMLLCWFSRVLWTLFSKIPCTYQAISRRITSDDRCPTWRVNKQKRWEEYNKRRRGPETKLLGRRTRCAPKWCPGFGQGKFPRDSAVAQWFSASTLGRLSGRGRGAPQFYWTLPEIFGWNVHRVHPTTVATRFSLQSFH